MPDPTSTPRPRAASGADPDAPPISDDEVAAITIGKLTPLNATIPLLPYHPAWPRSYALEAAAVRAVLGDRVVLLEHAGSTSVPGSRRQAHHRHGAGGPGQRG